MSKNAVLHGMVKEDLADKVTFRTRFTKEREPILRIYKKRVFQAEATASSRFPGDCIFDMYL